MPDDLRLETNFEHYISRKLNELSDSGWQISENDNGFDADTALYMDDLSAISWLLLRRRSKDEERPWRKLEIKPRKESRT